MEPSLPVEFDLEVSDKLYPETICATRSDVYQGETVLQWLIQWLGRSLDEATWEDALTIRSQFPDAGLEDKTNFEGGPSDAIPNRDSQLDPNVSKPTTWKVYVRWPKAHKGN